MQSNDDKNRETFFLQNTKDDFRSVFLSDTHLGFKGSKHQNVKHFLELIQKRTENIFLVGDIVDLWEMKTKYFFKNHHGDVITKLLKMSKKINTYYIPGNHDEYFRESINEEFGHIKIIKDYNYHTLDGRLLKILHGDEYDIFMKPEHKWISHLGSSLYGGLISTSQFLTKIQKTLGRNHWSLSNYVKNKSKSITNIIGQYEHTLATAVKQQHFDGVICGHIHKAEIREIDGITYYNDGDWVDNCTALVETKDGEFKLYEWYKEFPS